MRKVLTAAFVFIVLAQCTSQSFSSGSEGQLGEILSVPSNITFSLFATDMSKCDSTSACDLYVAIQCALIASDFFPCGQTSKRQDDNFPVWPEVFTYEHVPGSSQRWRFEIFDVDVAFDDLIATIEVSMDEYANSLGNLYQIPVPQNTGILWIQRKR